MSKKPERLTYTMNMGPQHPGTHGVLRLVLDMDGEIVSRAEPHIGLLHRGTEKLLENKTYAQGLPYFDRLDYVAPLNQEHAFVLAIEALAVVDVPYRGRLIRLLYAEISRILSHLISVTTFAFDVGAMTPLLWAFEEREKLMSFYAEATGARIHANYFRPGGVAKDLPAGLIGKIRQWCLEDFPAFYTDLETLLSDNRIFKERTVDVGIVSKEDAIEMGFSGVNLRASGLPWDIRKTAPYDGYQDFEFDIPTSEHGDCYARYAVRVAEMAQSVRIIEQVLDKLDEVDGPVLADNHKVALPEKRAVKEGMAEMIHHFRLMTDGMTVPEGFVYVPTETPKGEFGVHLIADGSSRPFRCRVRAPGFAHLQAMNALSAGHQLSDLVAVIGSLDIVFGEIDR